MKKITDAIANILENSTMSAKEIAEKAFGVDENGKPRKSHWSLYRELNPNDSGAKLGVVDLVRLMEVTGDVAPLELIAAKLGYRIAKTEVTPDKPTWEGEHVQDTQALGEMSRLMDAGASLEMVEHACNQAIEELLETKKRYSLSMGAR